ncbi:hypothetical protein D0C37_10725 [Streptomyces koyangensis]|uniref:Uncharacterized protein n=1 Tax=Streptomyces koyangensis TaxID=188770 RepID=A0A385D9F0_9ACTN|nr:hypothetical protein D0C37_10725 [Streptomyces koyangensis]
MRPSPITGLSTATTVVLSLATKINRGRSVFSPPTGGTTPTKRKGGDVPGCPRSKLHPTRLEATYPAPCSL